MEKLTDMKEVSRIARSFMRKWDSGVLSTQYETEGSDYPFGTLCPFVITEEGDVVVLISNIAVHTKNVKANHRVGFTVFDLEASHKQAAPRVCLVGDATIVDEEKEPERYEQISEKYLTFFPMARNYFKAHDFYFYTIRPKHIHFIRTFGQIYNYSAEGNWTLPTPEWKGSEDSAIEHMNTDHKDTLMKYSRTFLDKETEDVTVMAVDGEGFHMKVEDKVHYLNFPTSAFDNAGLRREFVALAKNC